jgi:hypothetical protein
MFRSAVVIYNQYLSMAELLIIAIVIIELLFGFVAQTGIVSFLYFERFCEDVGNVP